MPTLQASEGKRFYQATLQLSGTVLQEDIIASAALAVIVSSAFVDGAKDIAGSLTLAGGPLLSSAKDFVGSSALTLGAREDFMAVAGVAVTARIMTTGYSILMNIFVAVPVHS